MEMKQIALKQLDLLRHVATGFQDCHSICSPLCGCDHSRRSETPTCQEVAYGDSRSLGHQPWHVHVIRLARHQVSQNLGPRH